MRPSPRTPSRFSLVRGKTILNIPAHIKCRFDMSRPDLWLAMLLLAVMQGLSGCATGLPDGVSAVTPFDINRYLGRWYEIARLDHGFERGLSDVSATYALQRDGSVQVINRGYDTRRNEWRQVVGRARFIGDTNRGSLKVSFFGPFYGGYHVAALDAQDYRWAIVVGPTLDYFWLLARDRHMPATAREQLLLQAKQLGVDTAKVIVVGHTRDDP